MHKVSLCLHLTDFPIIPTVKLYRGGIYKFKINAPYRPFNIKTALTIGIGDRYSDGVENNGGRTCTITFTVPKRTR